MTKSNMIKEIINSTKKGYGYGLSICNDIFIGYIDGRELRFEKNTAENMERVRKEWELNVALKLD